MIPIYLMRTLCLCLHDSSFKHTPFSACNNFWNAQSIIFCFTCAHILFSVVLNCNPRQIVKPQLLYSIRSTITNWMLFVDLIIIAFEVLPGPKGTLNENCNYIIFLQYRIGVFIPNILQKHLLL